MSSTSRITTILREPTLQEILVGRDFSMEEANLIAMEVDDMVAQARLEWTGDTLPERVKAFLEEKIEARYIERHGERGWRTALHEYLKEIHGDH